MHIQTSLQPVKIYMYKTLHNDSVYIKKSSYGDRSPIVYNITLALNYISITPLKPTADGPIQSADQGGSGCLRASQT